jgi:hypothetical protein
MNEKILTTEERFENSIKHQPERYIIKRNNGNLTEVCDSDSGITWIRTTKKGWVWFV